MQNICLNYVWEVSSSDIQQNSPTVKLHSLNVCTEKRQIGQNWKNGNTSLFQRLVSIILSLGTASTGHRACRNGQTYAL